MRGKCAWRYDKLNECWDTECGDTHEFSDAPEKIDCDFCPYCGGAIMVDGKLLKKSLEGPFIIMDVFLAGVAALVLWKIYDLWLLFTRL